MPGPPVYWTVYSVIPRAHCRDDCLQDQVVWYQQVKPTFKADGKKRWLTISRDGFISAQGFLYFRAYGASQQMDEMFQVSHIEKANKCWALRVRPLV